MGLFDTPAVVHSRIQELKKLDHDYFPFDVIFYDEVDIFKVSHDYFGSPFYFHVSSWKTNELNHPFFRVEYFPTNSNILTLWKNDIKAGDVLKTLSNWISQVKNMLQFEYLYSDPDLESIRDDLRLKLGLTEENADQLINEVQKKHAKQFCDQIIEILHELDGESYDTEKLKEIVFDLEKIKRDIDSLTIHTEGELSNGIINVWGRIKKSKLVKFIMGEVAEGAGGKLIETIISTDS